jgi:small subunit ribosomal protein S4
LKLLELRLDNIVYRTGFAPSREAARQMIGHGHYSVNGRAVDRPSFSVKINDVIEPRDSIREIAKANLERRGADTVPWLKVIPEKPSVTLLEVPTREGIPIPIQEQLIVELYSK